MDTLGPLPEDENEFSFIVVIVDNFSEFVGLYPTRRTTSKDFIGALLQWVGVFSGYLKPDGNVGTGVIRFQVHG